MRYLKLFEELLLSFTQEEGVYLFDDNKGNQYRVYFSGPLSSHELASLRLSNKTTFELEFLTQHDDYTFMTDAGNPFTISNFIFNDILKDFLEKNTSCQRILIECLDKKRKSLYLRSLEKVLKDINFEIEFVDYPQENDIVISRVAKSSSQSQLLY